ncbi:MAG: chemotaxis protein CheD [Maricaulaceae bacterium]
MINQTKLVKHKSINVIQGDYAVSIERNVTLTTVLGSCVAACLYDPRAEVGGMNHFLLPGQHSNSTENMSYGLNAMELLINEMLKLGAVRKRFQAKLFGGANMGQGFSEIGSKNIAFAQEFLELEGIPCISKSLGGVSARRVKFWPATGQAKLKVIDCKDTIQRTNVMTRKLVPTVSSDVELF